MCLQWSYVWLNSNGTFHDSATIDMSYQYLTQKIYIWVYCWNKLSELFADDHFLNFMGDVINHPANVDVGTQLNTSAYIQPI